VQNVGLLDESCLRSPHLLIPHARQEVRVGVESHGVGETHILRRNRRSSLRRRTLKGCIKVGFLTLLAFSSTSVDPFRSGYLYFKGMSEGARRTSADLTCDSDFEPIAAGGWERAGVMEMSSRRMLRGPREPSQRRFSI
jgi:hypothetical protein